ncbi:MAG: polysaccharide deacetylase family protein [Acidobacteriaceae bacterium]|nr:polysaccharide deacetylase family protein [Acidobacteriaceae bacterium]
MSKLSSHFPVAETLHTSVRLNRMRPFKLAGTATGAALGALSALAAYGSVSKSSQLFGPSVYRGSGTRRALALTFDDGPTEGTLPILEYLAKQNVWATFFQCGMNVRRYPHIAREVVAAGHELGNHSYSHPKLPFKSPEFIEREFAETQDIIGDETGLTPMLLRPPYGFRWVGLREVQHKLALLGVMWTVIGNDWRWPARRIANHVVQHTSPGGIICMHDGRGVQPRPDTSASLQALKLIVPRLQDQGFRFEVVSDLMRD